MRIYCDRCGYGFRVKRFDRREIKTKAERITQVFFFCPKCGEEYTTYYETERVKELMAANQDPATSKTRRTTNMKAFQQEQKRIKELLSK